MGCSKTDLASRSSRHEAIVTVWLTLAIAGCGALAPRGPVNEGPVGGVERPVSVYVPAEPPLDPMPLVILLHGFTASGEIVKSRFGLRQIADERGFLLATPDGTPNSGGQRFWNAASACCNDEEIEVDDSAYLLRVIDDVVARWNVDEDRIFVMGHSNGGFMSQRMACDHADILAGVISIAGTDDTEAALCRPTDAVHVVHVHGTADKVIRFGGGVFMAPYLGAEPTVGRWARYNDCAGSVMESQMPLDARVPDSAETQVTRYLDCVPGGSVELWAMVGSGHGFEPNEEFRRRIADYIESHPKPE